MNAATKKIEIDLEKIAKSLEDMMALTPEQERQLSDTNSLMSWTCPGFQHIYYKLLNNNDGKYIAVPTPHVPIAATDGKNILINPETFFKLSVKERVYVMAHEVLHNVYSDVEFLHRCTKSKTVPMSDGTTRPFNNHTMQKAMDYRINALLAESRIGQAPEGILFDLKIADANASVLDVYKKLYKKEDDEDGGYDTLLPPGASQGQNPDSAGSARNASQWGMEITMAAELEKMKSHGRGQGAMHRMFKELLEPQVSWTDQIQTIFHRKIGSGAYDWRRGDRRYMSRDVFLPSRTDTQAGWIVIWGDTSGSITPTELNKYIGELAGIIEAVHPKRLTVIWCDDGISHVDEVTDIEDLQTIRARGVGGGGGTSVLPVLEWIEKNGEYEAPEMLIGFTDGHVTFPSHAPDYHVLWASTTDVVYPFGDVVRLK